MLQPSDASLIALAAGVVIPFVVNLVTKDVHDAPLKNSIVAILSTLGGVIPTVVITPDADWKRYVENVAIAFISTYTTHQTGIANPVAKATASIGLQTKHSIPKTHHASSCVAQPVHEHPPVAPGVPVRPDVPQPGGPDGAAKAPGSPVKPPGAVGGVKVAKKISKPPVAKKAPAKRAPRKTAPATPKVLSPDQRAARAAVKKTAAPPRRGAPRG